MKRRDFMAGVGGFNSSRAVEEQHSGPGPAPAAADFQYRCLYRFGAAKNQVRERNAPVRRYGGVGSFVATDPAREFRREGLGRDARGPHHQRA